MGAKQSPEPGIDDQPHFRKQTSNTTSLCPLKLERLLGGSTRFVPYYLEGGIEFESMKSTMKKPSSSSATSSTAPAAPVARKHTVEEFLKELKENGAKEGPVAKKRPEKSSWMPDFRNYHPPVEDAVSIPSSSRVSTPGSTSSGTFVPVPEDAQTHQMIQNILSLVGDEKYQHFANYMAALMKDAESHGRNVNLLVSQSIALFRNQELAASNPP